MQIEDTAWDGTALTINDAYLAVPEITFIGRGRLPLPPETVTVNGIYATNVQTDGDLAINIQPRTADRSITGQLTVYELKEGETVVASGTVAVGAPISAQSNTRPSHTQTIRASTIGTGTKTLTLSVSSRLNALNSWQSWNYTIDWSSTTRVRSGWNYNWGNNWQQPADTSMGGWDENWDQDWDG